LSSDFSIQGSEVPGTGSCDLRSPTGDGEAISHSTPLEPRTLSFCPPAGHQSPTQSVLPLPASTRPRTGEGEHWSPLEPVGSSHTGVWGQRPHYPDYVAQSYKSADVGDELGLQGHFVAPPAPAGSEDLESEIPEISRGREGVQLELACPNWALVGECPEGHHYAKELICGREWCSSCGGKNGKAHQRRKAAWLPRATQMQEIGSFVITTPGELRQKFREPGVLRDFGKAMKRVMKYHGFSRGLRRWHWFGEDHPGHGLQGDGMPVYHPHLNMLVEAGRLPASKLQAIKRSVATVLGVDIGRVNIHYRYARSVPKMFHLVKYVLRPTFERWEWDRDMAHQVIGFRNALSWGKWEDEPAWAIPDGDSQVGALEQGRCPVDGTQIAWGEVIVASLLRGPWWVDQGGGYRSWTGFARHGPTDPL